jgi:hypothetical protein
MTLTAGSRKNFFAATQAEPNKKMMNRHIIVVPFGEFGIEIRVSQMEQRLKEI